MKPLTITDLQNVAANRGGALLSDAYTNSRGHYLWRCGRGHVWKAAGRNILEGKWCPECSGRTKLTIAKVRALAARHGGDCLDDKCDGTRQRLRWRCGSGHTWEASYAYIRKGFWCPTCADALRGTPSRCTIEHARAAAAKHGGQCLSVRYRNNATPLTWRCREGHEWRAPYAYVASGTWCPECRDKAAAGRRQETFARLKTLISSRGGECLTTDYAGSRQKLRVRCANGHEWHTSAKSLTSGNWCLQCTRELRSSQMSERIHEMHRIAAARGGRCVSTEYRGGKVKLSWQCVDGHTWDATPNSVLRGSWCPYCRNTSENFCRTVLEQLLGGKFAKSRPEWLVSERGTRLELDGFCPEQRLAFEYQGEQHYRYIEHFHKLEGAFEQRQADDAVKRRLAAMNNVTLIEISPLPQGKSHQALVSHVAGCVQQALPTRNLAAHIDVAFGQPCSKLAELSILAATRGGACLGTVYPSGNQKIRWRCHNGHEWEQRASHVRSGVWCPHCAGNAPKDLAYLQLLAADRGGECLAAKYTNAHTKVEWRCAIGHTWLASPSKVANQGRWCPQCAASRVASKLRLPMQEIHDIAAAKGGACLSTDYRNNSTPLHWSCHQGHTWLAAVESVKRGRWCPHCRSKGRKAHPSGPLNSPEGLR